MTEKEFNDIYEKCTNELDTTLCCLPVEKQTRSYAESLADDMVRDEYGDILTNEQINKIVDDAVNVLFNGEKYN